VVAGETVIDSFMGVLSIAGLLSMSLIRLRLESDRLGDKFLSFFSECIELRSFMCELGLIVGEIDVFKE
jgi:hypothetical protein